MQKDFSRFSYFPIEHPELEGYYQRQKAMFWTPQELDLSKDRRDWDKMDENTRKFIKFVLFFFAQADGLINENLIENFKRETSRYKEASYFYSCQELIEVIHNETYSNLIEALIRDEEEKRKAFNAIEHFPSIGKMAAWMIEWMESGRPLTERIVAFACVEGIFFSGAFAAIYWVKRMNILEGLCKANEFIARDEALHTEFAVALYHVLTEKDKKSGFVPLEEERVHEIIKSALEAVEEFTREALRVDLVGMNVDDMVCYSRCCGNNLAVSLGYEKVYEGVVSPFSWMGVISLPNKTNFFEQRSSEYAKPVEADFEFDLDAEF